MKNTTLFFLLPLLAACSKGGPAAGLPSPEGTWRKSFERANGQDLWLPYYYEPCRLDDQWIFSPAGIYLVADSGLCCLPAGPAQQGSWRLEGNNLVLDSLPYEIVESDGRSLLLRRNRIMNGFSVRYELGFTALGNR
ncbi:MAG: hypothetical protein EOO15_10510 [Chitinophagaceae bacterium]|nr:MAG: hypothetical protein EOO15_10510 [Chitinophagaceae bacterium]